MKCNCTGGEALGWCVRVTDVCVRGVGVGVMGEQAAQTWGNEGPNEIVNGVYLFGTL